MRAMTCRGARAVSAGVSIVLACALPIRAVAADVAREVGTDQRIVVDPVTYEADITDPDKALLNERLVGGLSLAGFETTAAADQRVSATVTKEEGDYRVRVVLLEGNEQRASVEEICELCGVEELGEMLTAMGGRLRRKADLMRESALLRVETKPQGAQVRVDGEVVGTTPVEVSVSGGPHAIEVSKPGHRTETREIDAVPGTRDNYSFVLVRGGVQTWLPWTLLATGVVGVVAGGVLIGIDGNEIRSDCNADATGNCQFLHRTLGGGIALTFVGVGLVATGVALAIKWRSRRGGYAYRRPRFELTGAGIAGRF